jgi:hypothetical protein
MTELLKQKTGEYNSEKIQSNVASALAKMGDSSIANGTLIKNILINTDTIVNHGLGKLYSGFFVVESNNGVGVWNDKNIDTNLEKNAIRLRSSSSTTVSVWVF